MSAYTPTVAFDLQPTLKGDLLELRPLRSEDFDDLYAVGADPLIWEQHPVKNRHEKENFREFFEESLASGGALLANVISVAIVVGDTLMSRR